MSDLLGRVLSSAPVQRLNAALAGGTPSLAGGLWGSSSALITAALPKRPVLVIAPTAIAAEELAEDLETFTGDPPSLVPEAETVPQVISARLRAAEGLRDGSTRIVVASARAATQPFPSPRALDSGRLTLRKGDTIAIEAIAERLVAGRYERTHAVEVPGEFAMRGGILDIFPLDAERPVRCDFFGNEIESIRALRVSDQRSEEDLESATLVLFPAESSTSGLIEFLPRNGWIALVDPAEFQEKVPPGDRLSIRFQPLPVPDEPYAVNIKTLSLLRFSGALVNIAKELAALKGEVRIYCASQGEETRLQELLRDAKVDRPVRVCRGRLNKGFMLDDPAIAFVPHHELFDRFRVRRAMRNRPDARPIDSLLELEKGDIVVHLYHGIGRFLGMEKLEGQEFMALEYAEGAKVYVPVASLDLVQKYVGGGDHAPPLQKLGTAGWDAAKQRAQTAVEELAREMLQVQALRELELGISFPPDTDWQREFETAFPYEETEDQVEVAKQIKADMVRARPMDRLICGDVGYGKTELAMRAAFKAATAGKQVAVLVPTTVLAQQHYQTFRERMADYPLVVEVLSRFKTKGEQKEILERLAAGQVDIAIGTHRIVQKDVRFKDLGLVIIDEEQRFGVEHKEFLKRLRATVDVLTLTATPIPRTMHQSLLGIKDISALTTPPQDRIAIKTEVTLYNERLIRDAVLAELDRGGQVYFVHNRVYNIETVAKRLEMIVPEATFGIGHGQMEEGELEKVMLDFLDKKVDVLVCTTIIESGLDIPNVNTIFINNADQFGLADLHQLRGRVGRYTVQAHAYLLLPRDRPILPQAQKRIRTIEEFSELGAGFKIAMRDLEIRGVGNLLGREQSGHIVAVGYDLYTRLLERAVRRAKKEKIEEPIDANVELGIDASIPEDYIPELRSRVEIYRRLAGCRTAEELGEARREIEDRFGSPPEPVTALISVIRLKQLCNRWKFSSLARGREAIVAKYLERPKADELRRAHPGQVRIVDGETLWLVGDGKPESLIRLLQL